jgi:hypothetical protein
VLSLLLFELPLSILRRVDELHALRVAVIHDLSFVVRSSSFVVDLLSLLCELLSQCCDFGRRRFAIVSLMLCEQHWIRRQRHSRLRRT